MFLNVSAYVLVWILHYLSKIPKFVYFHKLKGISIVMSRHWHVRAGALYCLEYVVWHMYCTRSNLLCDIELILGLVYWLHLANLSKTLHLPRPAYLLLLFEDRDMSPSMNSSIMSFKHYLKQFLYASAYLSIDSRGIFWAIGIFHYVYDGRPLWSSSWLQGITAIWPPSRYTAWWYRHVCVCVCEQLAQSHYIMWNDGKLNPQPLGRMSNVLAIIPLGHTVRVRGT